MFERNLPLFKPKRSLVPRVAPHTQLKIRPPPHKISSNNGILPHLSSSSKEEEEEEEEQLADIELERLRNIERNKEILRQLGLA